MDHYYPSQWPESSRDGYRIHREPANHSSNANNPPFPTTSDRSPSCSSYYNYACEYGPRGENFNSNDESDLFYYYEQRANAANAVHDPWLIALLEDLRELYVRRRELFKQLFPKLEEEIEGRLEEALRSKRVREVRMLRRNLSVGSPRPQCSRGVGGDEQSMRLERFKVRTVDLCDEDGVYGGQGGQSVVASGGGGKSK